MIISSIMYKKTIILSIFIITGMVGFGQYIFDPIEFVGFINTDQLCLLVNEKQEGRDIVEKSVVVDKSFIYKSDYLTDSLILTLIENEEVFVDYWEGMNILIDIFHMFEGEDSMLNRIKRSHPVRVFRGEDEEFIVDYTDSLYLELEHVNINDDFYYRNYTTNCFLLVATTYRTYNDKHPGTGWCYGNHCYSFWMDPRSQQKVIVVIPLLCE